MFRRITLFLAAWAATTAAGAADESWLLITDRWGNREYQALELKSDGAQLSGTLGGDALQGRRDGDRLRFRAVTTGGAQYDFDGRRRGDTVDGQADYPDPNDAARRVHHAFTARRLPGRPAGGPRLHVFEPRDYANEFSPHRPPVLTIWPGDRVRTSTLDSGGVDAQGVTRALFGNPQTGPFYVGGAVPGDTLVVHIRQLRTNRGWADSLDALVARAQSPALAATTRELGRPVRWTIDRERNVAYPAAAGTPLAGFEVPLRPMLGGLAVAPGFGAAPQSTGDTGRNGGNMDLNAVVEGATVYLPVFQPGALLYLGDGHAAQGDGETSQYALETSLDVEFEVGLVHGAAINLPRVESAQQLLVLGQAGSLDEALRSATSGLIQWLQQDYGLDVSAAAQVLGSSVQYRVANLAGRSVGLVAGIDKSSLQRLRRREAAPQS
ncbi:acetamidase/formamidase family protein [Tahibacter caeni]|uniref:acetamidase/formamidase family protein n=1 Tax=Tahibacter caeni TaxID=1453545 RepID=UPI0021490025|nr:acetamidase/formamidase family protein [Tahibacter caeni]